MFPFIEIWYLQSCVILNYNQLLKDFNQLQFPVSSLTLGGGSWEEKLVFDLHIKRMGQRRGAHVYTFPLVTRPDYSDIKEIKEMLN